MFRNEVPPFPLARRLGLRFLNLKRGRAVLELPVTRRHLNPLGVVHGGVVFGLLDTAMGFAATSLLKGSSKVGTVQANVNFLHAVAGGRLRAEGRVVREGRNLIHAEGRLWDQSGRKIAYAFSSMLVVSAPPN